MTNRRARFELWESLERVHAPCQVGDGISNRGPFQREELMQHMKWIGGAIVGTSMMLAGTSAFAVTIGFSQVGDEGDWRPAFSKDMQEEAKKEGIDLKFADAQGKEE